MNTLTRWEKFTGYIAKSLVLFASHINATAVLSVCIETTRVYEQRLKEQENE